MYHEVTRKLALSATFGTPGVEFSLGVALGDNNTAAFQVQALSADGAISTLKAELQGSNDLCNWEDIAGASVTLTVAPDLKRFSGTGIIPWAFVRLKYTLTVASTRQAMLKAAIELFQNG